MSQTVYTDLEIDSLGVATLWLNRPEKFNALNAEFIAELSAKFKEINEKENIRLFVLRARGKNFCAGADIEWMKASANLSYEENLTDAKYLADMLWELNHIKVPTLVVTHGAAYGGAVGLIACCDMAIAIDNSKICLSEVNIGLIPATIGPYVQQTIGYKNSLYYSMTAEVIDAQIAEKIGLVQKVFSVDEADSLVSLFIQNFLKKGPKAQQACKELFNEIHGSEFNADLKRYTEEMIAVRRTSDEGQNGLQAFLEKMKPNWIN
ncbi:enoyl-CoA hydratase-related protein [Acinetobacter sp. Marseille-Q1623]|uniref:enoyl-CoA hydratase-related protein n=1 Tax=Acinetobacter sp. Marseille-Q1623 TaxID=2697501 RepID=UPI00157B6F8B|nr:enoyl-CoA hydratase-related protein [Acinetobacter sp. Marseille-Q1623]